MKVLFSKCGKRVCEVWLNRTLEAYSPEFARLTAANRDPFANPVGSTLGRGLTELFAALTDGAQPEACRGPLERIVRLKAVQEGPPSKALAFLPMVKAIVREHFQSEPPDERARAAVAQFEANVDRAAFLAFDIYTECRDRICELRVNELKRNTAGLLRRTGRLRPTPLDEAAASCSAACDSDEGCRP